MERFDTPRALAGVPQGQRDATCFSLAGKLRYAGVPLEMAEKLLVEAAANCSPEFPTAAALEKVRRAYQIYEPRFTDNPEKPFDLKSFALNGDAEDMEKQMLEDKFVLGKLAILGQMTAIYSKPNTGKTLLILWMLIRSIESGEINGENVFYINADDSHKGLVYKLKLANKHGFYMVSPGYKGFKAGHLYSYLDKLIQSKTASGKILILDTVKKFVDLMSKEKVSAFGEAVRQFVLHGGTVIMLAHVNKHRGEDNKLVFSGTSDLPDDADCAYTIDVLTDDGKTKTVIFENFKSRGDVARQAVYSYDSTERTPYYARLDSVVEVSEAERKEAEDRRFLENVYKKNEVIIESVVECIKEGINQKTQLVEVVHKRCSVSKAKIITALKQHNGPDVTQYQFWREKPGDNNSRVFELNYSVLFKS